jgi:hypothetical protein
MMWNRLRKQGFTSYIAKRKNAVNRIEICSRNSSVYPEDLGGHYRLQGETQWLLKGPEEQIK